MINYAEGHFDEPYISPLLLQLKEWVVGQPLNVASPDGLQFCPTTIDPSHRFAVYTELMSSNRFCTCVMNNISTSQGDESYQYS